MADSHWRLAGCLGVIWALSLLYGELGAFWLAACTWPPLPPPNGTEEGGGQAVRVAVIANPRLMDRTTYGLPPGASPPGVQRLRADLYLRRAFQQCVLATQPDFVFVIGDLFEGAPALTPDEWASAAQRFSHIFDADARGRARRGRRRGHSQLSQSAAGPKKIVRLQVAGMRDVGPAAPSNAQPEEEAGARYAAEFGELEYAVPVGAAHFLALDARALLGAREGDKRAAQTWQYLETYSAGGEGKQYPAVHAISGHSEHDSHGGYCAQSLHAAHGHVLLEEVGSFTDRLPGRQPMYLLLSVAAAPGSALSAGAEAAAAAAGGGQLLASKACPLPSSAAIIRWYLLLWGASLACLLLCPSCRGWPPVVAAGVARAARMAAWLSKGREKLKVDAEEEGEFDLMWDADGNMHLVRKARQAAPRAGLGLPGAEAASDRRSGGVQSRPSAAAAAAAAAATAGSGAGAKQPSLTGAGAADGAAGDSGLPYPATSSSSSAAASSGARAKRKGSVARAVSRRLLEVSGPLIALGGLQFAIYVGLLVKDWS
eukprot:jgi/Mesen1/350/ME000001S02657